MSDPAYRRYLCRVCGNETLCAVSEITIAGPKAPITFALRPVCENDEHGDAVMEMLPLEAGTRAEPAPERPDPLKVGE